jgi:FKBP-type peptidyl-prolyl cis-trans isomerase FkpA
MKLKFPLVAAFAAILSLSACGGGGGDSSNNVAVANPAALTKTDTVVGTGAEAATTKTATVNYTGWLYSDTAADHKGNKFDSGTFSFVVGAGTVIKGFDQGVQGMKVGGKRTVLIPSSLGYGASGSGSIPPNAGLVFDIELTAVK